MYRNVTYKIHPERDWIGEIRLDTWDEDGNPVTEYHTHESWCFFESNIGNYTSMFDSKLEKLTFKNSIQKYKWVKENRESRKIYENISPVKEFCIDKYQPFCDNTDFYKFQLRKQFFDIECATDGLSFPEPEDAPAPINVITIFDTTFNKYFIWVLPMSRYDSHKNLTFTNTEEKEYFVFTRETEMLTHFINWFHSNYPDVLSGWNIDAFDIPYLINRICKILPDDAHLKLSPIFEIRKEEIRPKIGKSYNTYKIEGISVLDYQFLYRDKFNTLEKRENYKLDTIARIELGVGKLDYVGTITEFWQNEFEKFVEYNRIDVARVYELDKKLKYIELARKIVGYGLCEFEEIYSSTPYIYGAILLQTRKEGKYVLSSTPGQKHTDGFEGAFVWPTIAGTYKRGITSTDLNSLYPNIMRTINISPETKIGKIEDESDPDAIVLKLANGKIKLLTKNELNILKTKCTKAGNNVLYYKTEYKEGIIPKLISKIYGDRVAAKGRLEKDEADIYECQELLKLINKRLQK